MTAPFTSWASDEIKRLRKIAVEANAEADALETTLKRYLASAPSEADSGLRQSQPPFNPPPRFAGGRAPIESAGRPRSEILWKALEASTNGLTLDELMKVAAENNNPVQRSVLRAQLWQRVDKGAIIRQGDRYLLNPKGPVAKTTSPLEK